MVSEVTLWGYLSLPQQLQHMEIQLSNRLRPGRSGSRFSVPEKALFDKVWKMPNIEKVN